MESFESKLRRESRWYALKPMLYGHEVDEMKRKIFADGAEWAKRVLSKKPPVPKTACQRCSMPYSLSVGNDECRGCGEMIYE